MITIIYDAVKTNRFDNKMTAINKVIQSKLSFEDDISICTAKVAIAMTNAKEK